VKVTVMGAGVIGVTSAYYLARRDAMSSSSIASREPDWRRASPMLARFRPVMPRPGPDRAYHGKRSNGCSTSMDRW
jgi:glycine/D-amino acid oxidase-like deaminating enzyme